MVYKSTFQIKYAQAISCIIYSNRASYNIRFMIVKYDLYWNHLTRNILFHNFMNDVKFSLAKERYLWRLVKSAWELLCLQKGLSQNFVKMMNRYETIWNISNAVPYRWVILLYQAWVIKIFSFLQYIVQTYVYIHKIL